MAKLHAISVNGKHLGSILADKICIDKNDNYLLFQLSNETVAMFAAENIEISTSESRSIGTVLGFTEYQSNRI